MKNGVRAHRVQALHAPVTHLLERGAVGQRQVEMAGSPQAVGEFEAQTLV